MITPSRLELAHLRCFITLWFVVLNQSCFADRFIWDDRATALPYLPIVGHSAEIVAGQSSPL